MSYVPSCETTYDAFMEHKDKVHEVGCVTDEDVTIDALIDAACIEFSGINFGDMAISVKGDGSSPVVVLHIRRSLNEECFA